LLAARGAQVVVNDVDAEAGVTDTNDVATEAGAIALVGGAVAEFGRIDVLINNAGIMEWADFPAVDAEQLERHLAVHLGGAFHTTRAAWPHMVEQHYGRIVMTTSTGIFGLPNNTSYAAAKAAVIGLTRSISTAGTTVGIKANLIAPAARTRMAGRGGPPGMDPALVAPMAAYLAHEDCPVNGEFYAAGGGRFARMFIASTPGYVDSNPSIESVAAHWNGINNEAGYFVPGDLMDWAGVFTAHLPTDAS
jgi:NAD(P)-dependent dehydrogenase (short-subunit alcohol dehydrogenase family)